MAARFHEFRSRADRMQAEQAAHLRQLVLDFPGLPERARSQIVAAIDGQTASATKWTFVMISPSAHAAVVDWLIEHSKRPHKAVRLWAKLFCALRSDTGEILLTRDELAEQIGANPREISEIMTELEGIGAISRQRERIAGMRGPGMVRYFMNPRVGTHLAGNARDKAQEAAAPLLVLMEGGRVTE